MIKIFTTLAALLLVTFPLKAQDTTKPFYFPHHKGDMWEYYYYDGPMSVDTLQNFTIFDSTEPNGIIFMKQSAQFINPTRPSTAVLEDTAKYWIDIVNNNVWGRDKYIGDSSLIYKLNVNKGEQWIVSNVEFDTSYYQIARVTNKWKDTLFSKPTTFMNISYYIAQDSTDTTGGIGGIDLGYDEIADGFGLISRGGGDSPGEINLIGAVINDTLYGDTTVVSIRDKKNILPTSIKLYQNYPNPFNPSTTISYLLSTGSYVTLKVYDILGREVAILVNEKEGAGMHSVRFDARHLSSGVYLYQIIADEWVATKKMIVLK